MNRGSAVAVVRDHGSDVASAAAELFRGELLGRQFGNSPEIAAIGAQFAQALGAIDPAAAEMQHVAVADKDPGRSV